MKKIQAWHAGSGSKLYAWVESKTKCNAEAEHIATGGDGDIVRNTCKHTNNTHFGDPVDIHKQMETAWRGMWQEPKTRAHGWTALMDILAKMPDFPVRTKRTGDIVSDTLRIMSRSTAPGRC